MSPGQQGQGGKAQRESCQEVLELHQPHRHAGGAEVALQLGLLAPLVFTNLKARLFQVLLAREAWHADDVICLPIFLGVCVCVCGSVLSPPPPESWGQC